MNIENTLLEIEPALNTNLYTLALTMTLPIPDICGALESSDGRASGYKYKNYVDG